MENAGKDPGYPSMYDSKIAGTMDQLPVTIKAPNSKGRLFLKVDL
jgi:hypothetical protein